MISVKTGDLLKSKSHALVNTVNCVGVMGKGVALAFKKRYPEMYADYVLRCERGEVKLGRPYVYAADDGHLIVNFPTKDHWRAVSRLSDIIRGLEYLEQHYEEWGIKSIAVPPLGCGNGQLEWRVVGPTLHRELSKLRVPVELFAPLGTPPDQMQLDFFKEPSPFPDSADSPSFIEPSWVALVEVLRRIENRKYRWPVGRVRFQKIAYFLTALGIPTALDYRRDSYGPYSANLKSVSARLVNNGLVAEARKGQMIEMRSGPTFDDAREAFAEELATWEFEIEKVVDLFARMPTDRAEVAATVHLVATELRQQLDRAPSEREVLDEVQRWKARRRPPITEPDIVSTTEQLALLRWIDVQPTPELRDIDDVLV
jgi:uncharacterized protein YwgA/O-acetyl-ADP-ribose deacetylase (regulator of RNase III)